MTQTSNSVLQSMVGTALAIPFYHAVPGDVLEPHQNNLLTKEHTMEILTQALPVGAIEYSLIYMLGGGGLIGAIVIFIVAKMLRR